MFKGLSVGSQGLGVTLLRYAEAEGHMGSFLPFADS